MSSAPDHTDTDSSMMFIAAKPATARHLISQRSVARLVGFGALGLERMSAVADVFQRRDQRAGRKLVLAPVDREAPVGEIQSRFDDTRNLLQAAFDLSNAAGAADALDRKIDMRSAVAMLHEQTKDRASAPRHSS